VHAHPNAQWRSYTAPKQKEVTDKINAKLAEEEISPLREDIVAWKMHTLIRDGLKNEKRKTSKHHVISSSRLHADFVLTFTYLSLSMCQVEVLRPFERLPLVPSTPFEIYERGASIDGIDMRENGTIYCPVVLFPCRWAC
jgi:hypothetical protein